MIERIILVEGSQDRLVWMPTSSAKFSCKSFRRSLASVGARDIK